MIGTLIAIVLAGRRELLVSVWEDLLGGPWYSDLLVSVGLWLPAVGAAYWAMLVWMRRW